MEIAGLALGAVSVASLFQTCMVTYNSINVYRHFQQDAKRLRIRFDANKVGLRQWGLAAKLGEEGENPKLKDPEVRKHVYRILTQINETLENNQRSGRIAESSSNPESLGPDLLFRRVDSISAGETTKVAWKERAKWVLRGKDAFEKQLEILEGFIDVLYRIVPDQESVTEHLDYLDKDISELTASLTGQSEGIQKIMETIEQKKLDLEELIANDARERVLKWLNPLPSEERYLAALRDRVAGTCDWLSGREEFRDWRSAHPRIAGLKLLWIHGPAGFGKTFTCARAVEILKESSTSAVAHFFCTSENETMRKTMSVLRTWLAQMVRQNEFLLREVYARFRAKEQQNATERELWHLFKVMCERVPRATFIVDGVDELVQADPSERLEIESSRVSFLKQLISTASSSNCHILMMSRKTADIEIALTKAEHRFWFAEIAIAITDVQSDINKFSKQSVQDQLSGESEGLRAELTEQMATKCDGMFLLVRLWTARLSPGKSTKKLRATVSEMPNGLDRAFERDLAMINDQEDEDNRIRAVNIIRWTMFANRALTVGELTEALVVCSGDDSEAFPEDELPSSMGQVYAQQQLLQLCGSLLEIRKSVPDQSITDHTVHFVHFTAREFLSKRISEAKLLEQPHLSVPEDTHFILADSCLKYLCYKDFDSEICNADDIDILYKKRPFLRYASNEWHSHAVKSNEQYGKLLAKTRRFLTTESSNWKTWAWNFEFGQAQGEQQRATQSDNGIANLLYYVTRLKYTMIMRNLLESGSDPNAVGGSQGCAVQAAAYNVSREAVELLLEYKVNINGQNKGRPGTLGWAIPTGSTEFISWLLSVGADVSFRSDTGASPLHYAITNERFDIVRLLLLESSADILATTNTGVTPLHDACMLGQQDLVELLLQQPNGKAALKMYNNNFSPLHSASFRGYVPVMETLVAAGADIDAAKTGNFTPLFFAARQGKLMAVEYFLNKGAKVYPTSHTTWSVLHAAIESKQEAVVEAIMSHHPPVNFCFQDGFPPITMAASKGLSNIVKILLQNGAIVNGNEGGGDPLPHAGQSGDLPTVEVLLTHGADVQHAAPTDLNALEYAAKADRDSIVRLLLRKGAKLRLRDNNNASLLHMLAYSGPDSMLRLILQELGTDLINQKDETGRTALFYAAENGHEARVATLIDFGADVNISMNTSASPLHEASRRGHCTVVKHLLSAGANVNARMTTDEGTSFYIAVQHGYKDLVELLFAHSADIDMGLKDGWTPLLKASYDGRDEIVKFLLDAGADLHAQNHAGNSALHYCVNRGWESLTRTLLEFESSLDTAKGIPENSTTQSMAVIGLENPLKRRSSSPNPHHGRKRLVELQNARSMTTLHRACQDGNASLVKLLISYGADPAIVDGFGHSCWDWGASMGDVLSQTGATERQPTSETTRKSQIRGTLGQIRSHLSDAMNCYFLGQCLMYLEDLEAAVIAFEGRIWYDDDGGLHHHAICNSCRLTDPRVGNMICPVRWVCADCFDMDLCDSCFDREKKEDWPRFPRCKEHRYLQIPRDVFKSLKPGTVDDAETLWAEWVDQLMDRYEIPPPNEEVESEV